MALTPILDTLFLRNKLKQNLDTRTHARNYSYQIINKQTQTYKQARTNTNTQTNTSTFTDSLKDNTRCEGKKMKERKNMNNKKEEK